MNFLPQFKQETAHALPPAALTSGVMGTGMEGKRGWDQSRCGTHPARLQPQHGAGETCSEQVCLHPGLPPPALFHFALELPALAPQPDLQQQQDVDVRQVRLNGSEFCPRSQPLHPAALQTSCPALQTPAKREQPCPNEPPGQPVLEQPGPPGGLVDGWTHQAHRRSHPA